VDVITFEFENIPAAVLDWIATKKPIHPRSEVLHICQNREREKAFLRANGYPTASFRVVGNEDELKVALEEVGYPAILKTADFGYDGKGQQKIRTAADADYTPYLGSKAVLEGWVDFRCEISVVAARGADGTVSTFPGGGERSFTPYPGLLGDSGPRSGPNSTRSVRGGAFDSYRSGCGGADCGGILCHDWWRITR